MCVWDDSDPCVMFPTLYFDLIVDLFFLVRARDPAPQRACPRAILSGGGSGGGGGGGGCGVGVGGGGGGGSGDFVGDGGLPSSLARRGPRGVMAVAAVCCAKRHFLLFEGQAEWLAAPG